MRIRVDTAALQHSRWYGHLIRFVLGGAITVAAGLVAKAFGPVVGGLLLAFPAILPAALILLARSQTERIAGSRSTGARGRRAAVLAASGAAMGSAGLIAFALAAWVLLSRGHSAGAALAAATVVWAAVAVGTWIVRRAVARSLYVPNLLTNASTRRMR